MEFLSVPLAISAFMLIAISLFALVNAAYQRSENQIGTDKHTLAYHRMPKAFVGLAIGALLMTSSAYIDAHATPTFRSAYSECVDRNGDNGSNGTPTYFKGTIARQSSCLVIAKKYIEEVNAN